MIREVLEEGIGSRLSALEREAEKEREAAKDAEPEPEQGEPEAEEGQPSEEDAAAQQAEAAVGKLGAVLKKYEKVYKEINQFLQDYKSNQFEDDQEALEYGFAALSENKKTRELIVGNIKAGRWPMAVKVAMNGLEQALKELTKYKKLVSGGQGDSKGLANLLNAFKLDYEAAQAVENAYLENVHGDEPEDEPELEEPIDLGAIRDAAEDAGMDPLRYIRLRALGKLPPGTKRPGTVRSKKRPGDPVQRAGGRGMGLGSFLSQMKSLFREELERELVERFNKGAKNENYKITTQKNY